MSTPSTPLKRTRSLRFRRWAAPPGVAPGVIFGEVLGSGIYVLEFADGSEYVGQSLQPNSRVATHRRHFADEIVAIRFTPVPPEELNRVEQDLITDLRDADVLLRNRTLLSQPRGASALDLIVDQEEQLAWMDADPARAEIHIAPERVQLARERISSEPARLPTPLREHPHALDAVESIAEYVRQVIPLPAETEGRGWVLSAWPSTNRTRDHRRFSTLSIQNVELLFLFEDRDEGGAWHQTMVLNVAPTLQLTPELEPYFEEGAYRTAGPVQHASLSGWHDLGFLLEHPAVLLAARELALGQLRKGRAMFSRFHSEALADEVFTVLGDQA